MSRDPISPFLSFRPRQKHHYHHHHQQQQRQANNVSEMMTALISEVAGTTLFAYVIGALVSIVLNLDPQHRLQKQQVRFSCRILRCTLLLSHHKMTERCYLISHRAFGGYQPSTPSIFLFYRDPCTLLLTPLLRVLCLKGSGDFPRGTCPGLVFTSSLSAIFFSSSRE